MLVENACSDLVDEIERMNGVAHDATALILPDWLGAYRGVRGTIIYPRGDRYIGSILERGACFCPGAETLFDQLVSPGDMIVDAGSNCGVFASGFADRVGSRGAVFAFEPQSSLLGLIHLANTINDTPQCFPILAFLSDEPAGTKAFPQPALSGTANFGGIGQDIVEDLLARGLRSAPVPLLSLDSLSLDRLDFLKIDVEGYEASVLAGGKKIIRKHRPIIWSEADRPDKVAQWLGELIDLGYRCSLHVHPYILPGLDNSLDRTFSFDILALPEADLDYTVDHRVYLLGNVEQFFEAIDDWNRRAGPPPS